MMPLGSVLPPTVSPPPAEEASSSRPLVEARPRTPGLAALRVEWVVDIPTVRTTLIDSETTTLFTIQTSVGMEVFRVERRFRDFNTINLSLRDSFSHKHPELLDTLPDLPPSFWKILINHQDPIFIEQRRQELIRFLRRLISETPLVKTHAAFMRFLGLQCQRADDSAFGLINAPAPLLLGSWLNHHFSPHPSASSNPSSRINPSPRLGHSATLIEPPGEMPSIWIYGGANPLEPDKLYRDCWTRSLSSTRPSEPAPWVRSIAFGATPGPLAGHRAVAAPHSADIVLIGGRTMSTNSPYAYLYSGGHWARIGEYPLEGPEHLRGHSAIFYRSSIWVFENGVLSRLSPATGSVPAPSPGPEDSEGGSQSFPYVQREAWPEGVAPLQWVWEIVDRTGPGVVNHSACVYQDSLYIFGGCAPQFHNPDVSPVPSRDIYRFDLLNRIWAPLTPGPKGLTEHSAVLLGHRIIVFGGRDLRNRFHNQVLSYNIHGDSWRRIKPLRGDAPSPRSFHSALLSLSGDSMYVYGGDPNDTDIHEFKFFEDGGAEIKISSNRRRRSIGQYETSPGPPPGPSSSSMASSGVPDDFVLGTSILAQFRDKERGPESASTMTAFDEFIGIGGMSISIPRVNLQQHGEEMTTFFIVETTLFFSPHALRGGPASESASMSVSVPRRFSEFQTLDAELRYSASSDVLSSIPELPKTYWKFLKDHRDPEFVEKRRSDLAEYLQSLKLSPFIVYHPAFLKFINREALPRPVLVQ